MAEIPEGDMLRLPGKYHQSGIIPAAQYGSHRHENDTGNVSG